MSVELRDWLSQLGVDPADVPADARRDLRGGMLVVETYVRDTAGNVVVNHAGDGALRRWRSVPVPEIVPAVAAEWIASAPMSTTDVEVAVVVAEQIDVCRPEGGAGG